MQANDQSFTNRNQNQLFPNEQTNEREYQPSQGDTNTTQQLDQAQNSLLQQKQQKAQVNLTKTQRKKMKKAQKEMQEKEEQEKNQLEEKKSQGLLARKQQERLEKAEEDREVQQEEDFGPINQQNQQKTQQKKIKGTKFQRNKYKEDKQQKKVAKQIARRQVEERKEQGPPAQIQRVQHIWEQNLDQEENHQNPFNLKVTAQEWVPQSLQHTQKNNANFTVLGVNINEEDRVKKNNTTQDQGQEEVQKKKKEKKRKIVKKLPKKAIVEQDTEQLKLVDPDEERKPCNIVFIGHGTVGKSTICGNILFQTGKIDMKKIEKYKKEAIQNKRDSWWLAYVMDINEEERKKGKIFEFGRANFETKNKRFTILDVPGNEKYVPNMIQGACQADYGTLVISARSDEFEAGFGREGQTREHAVLSRSLGIEKLIVCINKMDEVNWSEDRYLQIKGILEPYLESLGYNLQRDIFWIPCSGLNGTNIITKAENLCSWYNGPCFMELLDSLELPQRYSNFVRVSIIDRMKAEVGVNFFGKIESGKLLRNQEILIYPSGIKCNVVDLYTIYDNEEKRLNYAAAGENIRFKLSTKNKHIRHGSVICNPENPVPIVKRFEAWMQIMDHVAHKPIVSAGYQCVLHVHTAVKECVISQMLYEVDIETKKTKKISFAKDGQYVIVQIEVKHGVCMEVYKTLPYFGRFTLRDEGKTIAIGKLTQIIEGKEPEGENDGEEIDLNEEAEDEEELQEENQEEEEKKQEEKEATSKEN